MSTEQSQNQRRQSHRFGAGDAVQGELVLADRSRWPVRLLDQSAGGFAVETDGPTPLGRGDMAELCTDSFSSAVHVVYATAIEPGDEDCDSDADASESVQRFRLGLMRLSDLAIPSHKNEDDRRWVPWHLSLPANHRGQIVLFLGVLTIPVIAMIIFGILLSTRPSPSSSARSPADGVFLAEQSLSKRNVLPDSVAAAVRNAGTGSQSSAQVESRSEDLKHLPGAAPFVTAGVIHELQLTDAQLAKIRRILAITDEAIAENEECRFLFDSARKKVLGLLNDQQRQRWGAYSGAGKLLTEGDQTRDSGN
ncbi:MAG: hypothetical protein ACLP9L_21405 [Thermoguttaceae bacterium]